jgi:hypothetical protein
MKTKMHPILVQRSDTIIATLFAGICAASTGFIAAFLSLKFYLGIIIHEDTTAMQSHLWLFYVSATAAALLVGLFMWWRFAIKSGRYTMKQGARIGFATSIIAHPITWLFATLITYFSGLPLLGIKISGAGDILLITIVASYQSLLYVGWLTALIGSIVGALFMRAQRTDERT